MKLRHSAAAASIALIICGCSSPQAPAPVAPPPAADAPMAAPVTPAAPSGALPSAAPAVGVRGAPRDPLLETYKRAVAEKVHQINAKQLFSGRPHHLLQAVIVVEVTVDREGRVTRSKVLRSPGIARLDAAALASLRSASPLPTPPTKLVSKGSLVFSETWLFDNQSRFQLRTLALPQD